MSNMKRKKRKSQQTPREVLSAFLPDPLIHILFGYLRVCGFCREIEVPEKKLSINCSFCNTSFCCASCFKHHLQDQCICETWCCLDAKCSKCSKCSCQTCCTRCEKCRNLYHLACRPLFFWCDECHNALCHLCFQQTRRCAKCQSGRGLIRMYDT